MKRSSFLGNFYGSISGLSFYVRVPQQRHPLVLLHLLLLVVAVLIVALVPFARRLAAVTDRYVSLYDERFPEIHLVGNKIRFVGTIPTTVQLADGRQVVVDTLGTFTSVERMPPGSVLLTNRFLEVKTNQGVRRWAFDALHASTSLVITPGNVKELKNQAVAVTVLLLAVSGLLVGWLAALVLTLFGAGYVLLLCALTRTALRPRDAFVVAAYALTPLALVLVVVSVAGALTGPFLTVLWAVYCLLLAAVVLRIRRASAAHGV